MSNDGDQSDKGKVVPFRKPVQRSAPLSAYERGYQDGLQEARKESGRARINAALSCESCSVLDIQPRRGRQHPYMMEHEHAEDGLTPLGRLFVIRIEGCIFHNKLSVG